MRDIYKNDAIAQMTLSRCRDPDEFTQFLLDTNLLIQAISDPPGEIRLRAARQACGMTQAAAARRMGCEQALISKHEGGSGLIQGHAWFRYGRMYGVSEKWLQTGRGSATEEPELAARIETRLAAIRGGEARRIRYKVGDPRNPMAREHCRVPQAVVPVDVGLALTRRKELSDLITADRADRLADVARFGEYTEMHLPHAGDILDCALGRPHRVLPNQTSVDAAGMTPLAEAIARRAWGSARVLLETYGADPLSLQRFSWQHGLPAPTPWSIALNVEAPLEPVMRCMLYRVAGESVGIDWSEMDAWGPGRAAAFELNVRWVKRIYDTARFGAAGRAFYERVARVAGRTILPPSKRPFRRRQAPYQFALPRAVASHGTTGQLPLDIVVATPGTDGQMSLNI